MKRFEVRCPWNTGFCSVGAVDADTAKVKFLAFHGVYEGSQKFKAMLKEIQAKEY